MWASRRTRSAWRPPPLAKWALVAANKPVGDICQEIVGTGVARLEGERLAGTKRKEASSIGTNRPRPRFARASDL